MTAHVEAHRMESMIPKEASAFGGRRVYMIGIGGCGMSGLARLLRDAGATVYGSDAVASEVTDALVEDGFDIRFDQQAGAVPEACDMVVASAAVKPDHPEFLAAEQRGIEIISYAEALGLLQLTHTGISIAGTHGKSTTTAMLAHVLIASGLDPSFIVGAQCAQIGGGSRSGSARIPSGRLADRPGLLIAEACEFNRSFHHHRPTIALINNIEEDHLDVYGTLEGVIEAFASFASLLPPKASGGRLLIAHEGAHRREVASGLACEVSTFGFSPSADYQVVFDPGESRVRIRHDDREQATWALTMHGEHNALNTAAAGILAHFCGAPWDAISSAMQTFQGVDRRMQYLGVRRVRDGEVTVYDDYGHHPTEIEKTLTALRETLRPERLICVFQPHQHSRTRFLLDEFATSFANADVVIVPHIYFVRDSELERTKVSASDLVDRLRARGVAAMHVYPFGAIIEQLEHVCRPGDLLVIMGAGPVWQIGRGFLQQGQHAIAATE